LSYCTNAIVLLGVMSYADEYSPFRALYGVGSLANLESTILPFLLSDTGYVDSTLPRHISAGSSLLPFIPPKSQDLPYELIYLPGGRMQSQNWAHDVHLFNSTPVALWEATGLLLDGAHWQIVDKFLRPSIRRVRRGFLRPPYSQYG